MEDFVRGARELSPDAVRVLPQDDYTLRVRFANGELRDFDAKPLLERKCYDALRNKALFDTCLLYTSRRAAVWRQPAEGRHRQVDQHRGRRLHL